MTAHSLVTVNTAFQHDDVSGVATMPAQKKKNVLPDCMFKRVEGGYYNSCLT
jgi:hypothetical protein